MSEKTNEPGKKNPLLRKRVHQSRSDSQPPLVSGEKCDPGVKCDQPTTASHDTAPTTPDLNGTVVPGMVDAREKWASEIEAPHQEDLQLIRPDKNERPLIPFTSKLLTTHLHWLDGTNRGYYRCNGTDCILCRIKRERQEMDLLPLYDIVSQRVGVLAISPARRLDSLRPQMLQMFEYVDANPGKTLLVTIRSSASTIFTVHWSELPPSADDGRRVIKKFVDRLGAGRVQLDSVYLKLPNEELANLEGVAKAMEAFGISL